MSRTVSALCLIAVLLTIAIPQRSEAGTPGGALAAGFKNPPDAARPSAYWLWLNGYVNRDHLEQELQAYHEAGLRGLCIFDMGARGDRRASPPAGPPFMSDRSVGDIANAARVAKRLGIDLQLSVASSWDMGGAWVEPRHASMGLYTKETIARGPAVYDDLLPAPPVPARAPKDDRGEPRFQKTVAVLAYPADKRLPGHDFIFRIDPAGPRTLDYAVLWNTESEDPSKHETHLFTKAFSLAVSTTTADAEAFRVIRTDSLAPKVGPQRIDVPNVPATFVRLRLLSGHNPDADRIELAEFELFDTEGVNVVASHVADRSRDGAELVSFSSQRGTDKAWTAANIHDGATSGPAGTWSSAGPPPVWIENRDDIVDLTDHLKSDGRLVWNVPEGVWEIARLECMNTGERLKVPSPQSDGLATDHLSAEATRAFLGHLVDRLETELGPLDQTALEQLYLASYEVRGPIWTPELPAQFRRYRGYDIRPYLPVLSGKIVVSPEVTARFLYDYRKTLGDLLIDAYYRAAVEVAHAAGLGIESEAGGPGPPVHQVPVDALAALGAIDEIRGEFWPKRPDADALWVVKETACAGHIYGKRRIHMEAFTSMHHWQDGPFDLQPSADRAFCEGANHMVWHTGVHLPPEAGRPGWAYLAGTHLNTNLVWWPKAKAFLDYLARCSYLLQRGHFVGDVCYYYGDQGYNFVPPKHVDPSLGPGYDYDVTNRDVLLNRMEVSEGRIVLPDAMRYEVLVLPEREDIDLAVLEKIESLVQAGATVVGPKPTRTGGLTGFPERDQEVQALADRLWGDCDGRTVFENRLGQGRIVWGPTLRRLLRERGIGPDFQVIAGDAESVDYIHRREAEADIYFVRNTRPEDLAVTAHFRVRGRAPQIWDPVTGDIRPVYVYDVEADGTSIPLRLAPYASTFVVFVESDETPPRLAIDHARGESHDPVPRIDAWDGRRAVVTLFEETGCRIACDDGRAAVIAVEQIPPPLGLDGPWDVTFQPEGGAPPSARFDRLTSWTEHPDDRIRHFSGIATYRRTFELAETWTAEDTRLFLDLGDLWSLADVAINGQPLGVLWRPPYRVEITGAVRPGTNRLTVEVANTWSNRLVGDAGLPPEARTTQTNVTSTGGLRWKDVPLKRSGLFGPVRIVPAKVVTSELR